MKLLKTLAALFLLVYSIIPAYGQSDNTIVLSKESAEKLKEDIIILNARLDKLIRQNDSINDFNELLISNNYALNNKLRAEQFKGELFESVLNEQTYRFLFLIVLIVLAGSGLTIYAIRDKGSSLEMKLNSRIDEINKTFSKNQHKQISLEKELFSSLGNVNYSLARQFANDGKYLPALNYLLLSAMYIHKTIIGNNGKLVEGSSGIAIRLLSLLTTAESYIEVLPKSESGIERFRALFTDMITSLDEITRSPSEELNIKASIIKQQLISLEKL